MDREERRRLKQKEANRARYLRDKDRILNKCKQYHEEHKEVIRDKKKQYHDDNKDRIHKRKRDSAILKKAFIELCSIDL